MMMKPQEPIQKQSSAERNREEEPIKPNGTHDVERAKGNDDEKKIIVASYDSDDVSSDVSNNRDRETRSQSRQWWKLW